MSPGAEAGDARQPVASRAKLNLPRLSAAEVTFAHGDICFLDDLLEASQQPFDVVVECSAEPSVLVGVDGTPDYCSNRTWSAPTITPSWPGPYLLFLSTSRVYPVAACERVSYGRPTRGSAHRRAPMPGPPNGISEDFPLAGARTP